MEVIITPTKQGGIIVFENEKIKLRKLSAEDYMIYHEWRNDSEVMRTTSP